VETLLEQLRKSGGLTLNPQGKPLITNIGCQVGTFCFARMLDAMTTYADFADEVERCLKKINHGEYLGLWIDKGTIHLDRSLHILDYREAMSLGKANHQISIYDWSSKDCIPCE
jgi:hypothetical protein